MNAARDHHERGTVRLLAMKIRDADNSKVSYDALAAGKMTRQRMYLLQLLHRAVLLSTDERALASRDTGRQTRTSTEAGEFSHQAANLAVAT